MIKLNFILDLLIKSYEIDTLAYGFIIKKRKK